MIPEIFNTLILDSFTSNIELIGFFNHVFLIFPAYSINSGFVRLMGILSENDFCQREPAASREVSVLCIQNYKNLHTYPKNLIDNSSGPERLIPIPM